jgi:uncharacterized protein (TIGR03435 family)
MLTLHRSLRAFVNTPRHRRSSLACATVLLSLTPAIHAQLIVPHNGETLPTFEVATIKPSSRDLGRSFHTHIWRNDNSYRTENTTLRDLIRDAFDANSPAQLTGGPDSLLDSRWDLNAKIGDEEYAKLEKLSRDDRNRAMHLMVQPLLANRFALKVQVATRELPVFNLVIEKGGSKLQPAAPETTTASAADPQGSPPGAPAKPHGHGVSTNINHDQGTMTATDATPADLTVILGRQPELDGRTVIDKTGLTSRYDWTLQWQPQRLSGAPAPDAAGPSLFTALREQLGLGLEPSRGSVEVVVVDAVSGPTPN